MKWLYPLWPVTLVIQFSFLVQKKPDCTCILYIHTVLCMILNHYIQFFGYFGHWHMIHIEFLRLLMIKYDNEKLQFVRVCRTITSFSFVQSTHQLKWLSIFIEHWMYVNILQSARVFFDQSYYYKIYFAFRFKNISTSKRKFRGKVSLCSLICMPVCCTVYTWSSPAMWEY